MSAGTSKIIDLIQLSYGLDISIFEDSFLEQTLIQGARQAGCHSREAYANHLTNRPDDLLVLKNLFSVSYSAFFRNPLTFSVLEKIILPGLLFSKPPVRSGSIRIWSAACAGGHEPYSLAMLLESFSSDQNRIDYQIFGTDHDPEQIRIAKLGSYRAESLQNVPLRYLSQWFAQEDGRFTILPDLKRQVALSVFDLLNEPFSSPPESIFGEFDIILCANLLFYYKPAFRKAILEKVKGALALDGLVITGESERQIMKDEKFREVYPESAVFSLNHIKTMKSLP